MTNSDTETKRGVSNRRTTWPTLSIRTRVFFELVAFAMVPLVLVSTAAVMVTRQQAIDDRLAALEAIAEIQQNRVEALLLERDLDYGVFLSSHWLFEAGGLIGECTTNPNTEKMNALLQSALEGHPVALDSITLIDHDGCVQASTNRETVGDDLSDDPTFLEGSHGGPHDTATGDLRHNPSGDLVVSVMGPLFIGDAHIATVVFDANADWLAAWAMDYTGLGDTGETVFGLLDVNGDAKYMTPLRFDPHAALVTTVPMTSLETPIVQALLGNETTFEHYTDYRGVDVLAVTRHVSDAGWGVVVKMDTTEALSTATNLTVYVAAANVMWLLILVGAAAVVARRRTEPIRKITDTAVLIASGDLDHRVDVATRDELGVLAAALNDMADELVERQRTLESEVRARTSDLSGAVATLESRNQDLERMAVVAAHDLSEPLRKIRVFGERLADSAGDALDDRSRNDLERMTSAVGRMQSLIDGLLEYSRITTRAQSFERVDLYEITRGVVSDLEVAIAGTGATIEIGDLPSVMAEPTQMRQLIQNLISNSLKFHLPDETPWVRIAASIKDEHSHDHTAALCVLIVEDHGIGIPLSHRESVFDLFTRLQSQSEYPGSGLGLPICRRIVQHHQGTLTVEPNTPNGTRMIARFPVTPTRVM